MKDQKSAAAVELGRKRAIQITVEERRRWARERWAATSEKDRKDFMEKVRKARG